MPSDGSNTALIIGNLNSAWIYKVLTIDYPQHSPSVDENINDNPELLELLRRLCYLTDRAVIPIFAFESPGSLCFLNGTEYRAPEPWEQWLITPFQQFIEAFGFFWFTVCFPNLFWKSN